MKYDFAGWATKNDVKCADGRTIRRDAFKGNDGKTVPLVWAHNHYDQYDVLGHVLLENREDGVYAYGSFNDTEEGKRAKELVRHGDITGLSIYANNLKQNGGDVLHGHIKEVSLVLASANPEAYIESVIQHGIELESDAIIYSGCKLSLAHEEKIEDKKDDKSDEPDKTDDDKTVQDVVDTMNEEQKAVMFAMVGKALEKNKSEDDSEGGKEDMKHNIFDQDDVKKENTLSHDEMATIISGIKRYGSLKESFLAHKAEYGIENIDYLFPDAKTITNTPEFISRDMGWVNKVMNRVHHTPFSRIKSVFADITEDEARAKGYIKGKLKKEEVFSLLKRVTGPTTVYKKQKLDRDDIVDITDFDMVSWLKGEMRTMLDEEIARAILIGDGRLSSVDDKIKEDCIRPIWKDEDLYTVKVAIDVTEETTPAEKAKNTIKSIIKSRKDYKGSGSPTLYTTEDNLTEMLLLEDTTGRLIYTDEAQLARTLRVNEIVTVPVMENQTRDGSASDTYELAALIVNLTDYNVGADKGGAVNMFDDFDIDYNQQKYLIETRCSGALTRPYSAIAIEYKSAKAMG